MSAIDRDHHTVVVGAGAAGAALAVRLATEPGRSVTLVEAGTAVTDPELLDGGLLRGAEPGHVAQWRYQGELLSHRETTVVRGKALGGSTAINGGYFVRATPADFDRWSKLGGTRWSYDQALPRLRRLEHDLDFGDRVEHGDQGPVLVQRPPQDDAATVSLAQAAHELGVPWEHDKNAGAAPGVGAVPSNIIAGVRRSTAMAFLADAPPALKMLERTRALRIDIDRGRRVRAVETNRGTIPADDVVLAAGSLESPGLLVRSGIGPRATLDALGIPCLVHAPVGHDFQDHPNLALAFLTHDAVIPWQAGYAFPTAINLDASVLDARVPSHPEGDVEVLLAAKPLPYLLSARRPAQPSLHLLIALQDHRARGTLEFARHGSDLDTRVRYRYLEHAQDRSRFRAAVRFAVSLLREPASAAVSTGLADLDDDILRDDRTLDAWNDSHLGTALHTCGTAAIGRVVDGEGRVLGVSGLRVADTSILPSAPHRGPANTAVFIGDCIADAMVAAPRDAS